MLLVVHSGARAEVLHRAPERARAHVSVSVPDLRAARDAVLVVAHVVNSLFELDV